MQQHPDITRARILSYMAQGKLLDRLYPKQIPLKFTVFSAPDRISFAQAAKGKYRNIKIGQQLGPVWSTHWIKCDITIPRIWRGQEIHLRWDSSSEACVWHDGVPMQGLTGSDHPAGGARPIRTEYVITPKAAGGEKFSLYIEVACNQLVSTEGKAESLGKIRLAEIAVCDRRVWDLNWDLTVIAEMATTLPSNSPRAAQALFAANAMINCIDYDEPQTWSEARKIAAEFFAAKNGDGQHNINAIGHAHIDTAWLWPLAETKRKCYRSFSSALRYMETYPEFQFACSQAQQYEWMKIEQPALYAKMKKQIQKGNFIPVGGTWIEPDCNMPSGESLVRQFLFGMRYFQQEFGIACKEFWNPDVFGYNGQLPQIMRGFGIEFFLTQKLSQNEFNKPKSQTFWWQGIDGSKVFTHFPPADNYLGNCSVQQLQFNVQNYKELDRSNESLYLFGFGDGGGGPTMEMLERLRRARDVDGLPRVKIVSPKISLPRVKTDAKLLTTHVGEMYFETHRGTYTTQAKNKRDNRRAEELLHDVEMLGAFISTLASYPRKEMTRLWKLVLLNQFHDIIPGCSISAVYEDSAKHYEEILSSSQSLREKSITKIAGKSGKNVLAINTLSTARTEVVELPGTKKQLGIVHAPSLGFAVQQPVKTVDRPATITQNRDTITLENQFIRAIFKTDGSLISLFDKQANREAIAHDSLGGNRFVIYGDQPVCYDAWNADVAHLEKRREVPGAKSAKIIERDPLRISLEFQYDISSQSKIRQIVSLDAISHRLDFTCDVSWHETQKFLKVEFPTTLQSDFATYEIQFGHVRRPTHFNNSFDLARFEVCAHRWADLSESDFGLALLNDCKYGYATHGNVMRLSLLRAPKYPDPQADMGEHHFRYALLPHSGSLQQAGVIHEARRFNSPMILRATSALITEQSWLSVCNPGVVIDTIKPAEDGDEIIVRLYESHGTQCTATLQSKLPVHAISRCNMLEIMEEKLNWKNNAVNLTLRAFEILTLKMQIKK